MRRKITITTILLARKLPAHDCFTNMTTVFYTNVYLYISHVSAAVASFGNEPNLSVDFPQLNATVLSAGIPIVQLLNRKLNSTTARPERKFPLKVFTNVKSSDFPDVFFSSDGFENQPKSSQEVVKKSDRFTLTRAANYDGEHPLNQLLDIGLHLNNFIGL